MYPLPPIGVANSISANFQYDPLDTIQYSLQGKFDILQIYLNSDLLKNGTSLGKMNSQLSQFKEVYFHVEGFLNDEFEKSEYRDKLYDFLKCIIAPKYIIHFDERMHIDKMIKLIEQLSGDTINIYVENYFLSEGKVDAEKNLKKYMALFTLSENFGHTVYPVLDIPRLFHKRSEFTEFESLEWCYQILNFFGNRRIPILLHLIDAATPEQQRHQFSALGQGCIPYQKIFQFIRKTRPKIAGIILEFEDKINPLHSRDYLTRIWTNP